MTLHRKHVQRQAESTEQMRAASNRRPEAVWVCLDLSDSQQSVLADAARISRSDTEVVELKAASISCVCVEAICIQAWDTLDGHAKSDVQRV